MKQKLRAYFDDLCAWIVALDVGSNQLNGTEDTAGSIFINGNFARVLMASYRITGNEAHREEALRWGDTFCANQQRTQTSRGDDAGYWPDIGPRGNIYFGDAGTAAHALASIYPAAAPGRQETWRAAMERMARFVIDGCAEDPQGQGRDATHSWVIREGRDAGALGCGYYRGKLSVEPYTIATATTGGAFFSELYAITKNPSTGNWPPAPSPGCSRPARTTVKSPTRSPARPSIRGPSTRCRTAPRPSSRRTCCSRMRRCVRTCAASSNPACSG